jgi:hypothetical protein
MSWRSASAVLAVVGASAIAPGSSALASGNRSSCCELPSGQAAGACVAQPGACASSAPFSVWLWQLDAAAAAGWPLRPGAADVTFPDGVNGYLFRSDAAPWFGFCLDAPSPGDPTHAGPTEPVGCLSLSMAPGVGAAGATVDLPIDPRWDAFQICFGAATDGGCAGPGDPEDATLSPTPVSHSCCGPAQLFTAPSAQRPTEWEIGIGQEIPGVPPPIVVFGPDGGIIPYARQNEDDTYGPVPPRCLSEYHQPANCGQPPDAGVPDAGASAAAPASAAVVEEGCSVAPRRPRRGEVGLFLLGLAAAAGLRRSRHNAKPLARAAAAGGRTFRG